VRAQLVALVAACVLPATVAAAFALTSAYREMHEALAQRAQANSRAMARAVDGVISTAVDRLERIAASPEIAAGDLALFEHHARELAPFLAGSNLVLSEASGRQLVNTALPPGAPLPMHGNPAFQRTVLSAGRPAVSDLFTGGAFKRPLVAIEIPVRRDAAVPWTLAMGFLPERFGRIIAEQQPEPDWVVSIFDGTGTIVARTHEPERFVGHKGAPALLAAMARQPQGIVDVTTLEGTPVIAAYTHSQASQWTVAVGIPQAALMGRLERWIAWLVAFSAGMLVLATVLARWVSARIAGAIRSLLKPALALGRGDPVLPQALAVAEAQVVADALVRASALLHERTRERDQAAQARQAIQRQADAFEHAAEHDALTGLPNRACFMRVLQEHIERRAESGGVFTVLFVDVDDFKPVNDLHGHAVGDELLCAFAARLRGGFRDRDLVARLAGDEFAVLVDGRTPQELQASAAELLAALARPYGVRHLELRIRASIGAAAWPVDGRDAHSLLHAADTAMYRAKAAGKGGYSMHSPG